MQKSIVSTALAAVLVASGAVFAADLGDGSSMGPVYRPANTWVGAYIGATGGYSGNGLTVKDRDCWFNCVDRTVTNGGFAGGGVIGANMQKGGLVYGVEADITALTNGGWEDFAHANPLVAPAFAIKSEIDALATVRGRVGLAVDPALLYVTAGLALGEVHNSLTTPNANHVGWFDNGWQAGLAAGTGLEAKWSPRLSWKVEGLYYQLGDETATWASAPYKWRQTFTDDGFIARVGLNYSLTGVWEPLK